MYSPRSISPGISRDTWPFEVIPMTARPVTIVSEAGATVSESLALSPEQERARAVLGGAVAELLSEKLPLPLVRVGMRDCFGTSGEMAELMREFELDAPAIASAVDEALSRKNVL